MERPSAAQAGIAAAVAVLVPVIVGIGAKKAAEAEPKPAEASVSVGLLARSWWLDDGSDATRYLLLRAAGPPPGAEVRLVDTSGQNSTTVIPVKDPTACSGALRRDSGLTNKGTSTDWCLRVGGLRAGSEVKGLLEGEQSKVTLTMALRHRFWFTPFVLAILAFAAGVATLFVVPLVRKLSHRSELEALVADNREATEARRINDLGKWVEQQQSKGVTDDTLLPIVERVIRYGPTEARRVRRDLGRKLETSTLPTDQPIRRDAAREARTIGHDRKDFLDEDRAAVIHPATTRAGYIDRLEKFKDKLDFAATRIANEVKDDTKRRQLEQELNATRSFFNRAEAAELDDLGSAIVELHRAIDKATGVPLAAAAGAGVAASEPKPLELPTLSRKQAYILRGVIVGLSAVVGLVAVAFSVYLPTATFGAAPDYYRLMAAAAGSGAIATAVSILNWRSPSGEESA